MPAPDQRALDWPERAAALLRRQPELRTARLLLRRVRPSDAPAVFAYGRDPEVARYTSWPPHRALEDAVRFVEWVVAGYERGEGANWAIVIAADDRLVGTIGFGVQPAHRSAEVGYAIAREEWGRGIVTEALDAVLGFAFDALGLHRVIARCEPENVGSWKVMRKAGMTFEGLSREAFYAKGRFADLMVWSLLDREWRSRARGEERQG